MGSKLAIHSPFGPLSLACLLCEQPPWNLWTKSPRESPHRARTRAGILSTPLKLSNCSKKEKKKEKKEVNMLDL